MRSRSWRWYARLDDDKFERAAVRWLAGMRSSGSRRWDRCNLPPALSPHWPSTVIARCGCCESSASSSWAGVPVDPGFLLMPLLTQLLREPQVARQRGVVVLPIVVLLIFVLLIADSQKPQLRHR
jgi:hypothetical protein